MHADIWPIFVRQTHILFKVNPYNKTCNVHGVHSGFYTSCETEPHFTNICVP